MAWFFRHRLSLTLVRCDWLHVCGKAERRVVPATSRYVRGVGTASGAGRAAQVGVAYQLLRPATTHADTRPPTLPTTTQFPTQLWLRRLQSCDSLELIRDLHAVVDLVAVTYVTDRPWTTGAVTYSADMAKAVALFQVVRTALNVKCRTTFQA